MKLKDFQVGQTVYLIERRPKPKDILREYQVVTVGRKYLKVQGMYNELRAAKEILEPSISTEE